MKRHRGRESHWSGCWLSGMKEWLELSRSPFETWYKLCRCCWSGIVEALLSLIRTDLFCLNDRRTNAILLQLGFYAGCFVPLAIWAAPEAIYEALPWYGGRLYARLYTQ